MGVAADDTCSTPIAVAFVFAESLRRRRGRWGGASACATPLFAVCGRVVGDDRVRVGAWSECAGTLRILPPPSGGGLGRRQHAILQLDEWGALVVSHHAVRGPSGAGLALLRRRSQVLRRWPCTPELCHGRGDPAGPILVRRARCREGVRPLGGVGPPAPGWERSVLHTAGPRVVLLSEAFGELMKERAASRRSVRASRAEVVPVGAGRARSSPSGRSGREASLARSVHDSHNELLRPCRSRTHLIWSNSGTVRVWRLKALDHDQWRVAFPAWSSWCATSCSNGRQPSKRGAVLSRRRWWDALPAAACVRVVAVTSSPRMSQGPRTPQDGHGRRC